MDDQDSSARRVREAHAGSRESQLFASAAGPAVADAADAAVAESLAVDPVRRRSARIKMVLMFILFSMPVVASYLAYYVFQPQARSNYGDLVMPQIDLPDVPLADARGEPFKLSGLRGKWVMVVVDDAACDDACRQRLWVARQVRLTTGKDRDRVERLWIARGEGAPDAALLREHEGLVLARTTATTPDAQALARLLPPQGGGALTDHIWLVDPLGHVMMRFPKDADPNRMKKDLAKLLKASRIG